MTILAVLSDIHGNLPAFEAACRDLAAFSPDHVVVAGALINWGPSSREVLERVAALGWVALRGNNELYLTDFGTPRAPTEWADPVQYSLLPWLQRQVGPEWRRRIAAWPDEIVVRVDDAPPLRIAHGLPGDPWGGIRTTDTDESFSRALSGIPESTFVTGHTHLQFDRRVGARHVVNPGSVGVPLGGRHEAQYAILDGDADGWRATLRRTPFDVEPLLRELERIGYVEELGLLGRLCAEELRTARMHVVTFFRWRDASCPDEPLAPALLERYLRADWARYVPEAYRAG